MKTALELYNSFSIPVTMKEFLTPGNGAWGLKDEDYWKAKRLAKSIVGGDMTPHLEKSYDKSLHSREFLFAEWMEGRIKCKLIGFIYGQTKPTPKAKKVTHFRMGIKMEIWATGGALDSITINAESWTSKGDDDYMSFLGKQMTEWLLPENFDIQACVEEFRAHLMEAGRYE